MALSPAAAMKKHNLQLWTSTTAAVLILLLQFMGTSSGLALDAQHGLVPLKESSSQQRVSVTVEPKFSGPKGPAFDFGAKYRPPIINFKYQGGLVSVFKSLVVLNLMSSLMILAFHKVKEHQHVWFISSLRGAYLLIPFVCELEKAVYISNGRFRRVLFWP